MNEWLPTEETRYSHSTDGWFSRGEAYSWMGVENVEGKWHGFVYATSPPRNERGDFSYDLFPDNDNHMYTVAGGTIRPTMEDAFLWCLQRDQQLKEILRCVKKKK